MLLMGLSAGADGGIGTTYNFMPRLIKQIYTSFRAGDITAAQKAQTEAVRIISVLLQYKIIPAMKIVLQAQGYDVGNATFPMKRYSPDQQAELLAKMKLAGLEF